LTVFGRSLAEKLWKQSCRTFADRPIGSSTHYLAKQEIRKLYLLVNR